MYKFFSALLIFIFISCNDETQEKNISIEEVVINKPSEQDSSLSLKKDTVTALKEDSILTVKDKSTTMDGVWLNEIYYNALTTSKSPYKSQLTVRNSVVVIPKKTGENVFYGMNFHEGLRYELKKDSHSFFIETGDGTSIRKNISLKNNKLFLGEDEFIKIKDTKNKHQRYFDIAEQLIFTGKYSLNGRKVEFTENGKIFGLDSLKSYSVFLDYIEQRNGPDQLRLGTSEDSYSTYGFQFLEDTLEIYSIKCDDHYCHNPEFDKRLYKLIKEN